MFEIWVIPLVEDDEARVHPVLVSRTVRHSDRVRVAAGASGALEHREVVIPPEDVPRHKACNPRSDYCDSHVLLIRELSVCDWLYEGVHGDGCFSIRAKP